MESLRKLMGTTIFFSSWYLKNKYSWIGNLIYPISFYVILSLVGGGKISNHAMIGALISSVWMSGVGYMPQFLFSFKFIKLRDMFVAAPIHPLTYMLGAALSVLISSLPSICVLLVPLIITLQLTAINMINLAFTLLVTWLMSSCLGFIVAGYVNDPTRIGTISPYIGAVLTTLPPVYYPLEIIPRQYWGVALLAPTAHLSQLAKIATGISTSVLNPLIHIVSILLYLVAFMTLASFRSRWREK